MLHVRNLTCQTGLVTCSPATFLTLYSLCEGRRECDASGLRTLMPVSMYCGQSASPELCNVFVDYLCVPSELPSVCVALMWLSRGRMVVVVVVVS